MRTNVDGETLKKQSPEDKIWFVIIRKKFLITRERQRDQSLETLIIIQCVERYETLPDNFLRVAGRRGLDKIQDLRSNLLRKDCDHVVELGLADRNISDHKRRHRRW